jgi:hypothetical protein
MNTDPGDSGQADYIHRRIKRALAFKALREMRKTVDALETEEHAEKQAETRIVLGIWIAIFLLLLCIFAVIHITTSVPATLTGSITSWDRENSVGAIALSTGKKIECSFDTRATVKDCTITMFNMKELESPKGIVYSIHKSRSSLPLGRTLYFLYQDSPKDNPQKSAAGQIIASNPL